VLSIVEDTEAILYTTTCASCAAYSLGAITVGAVGELIKGISHIPGTIKNTMTLTEEQIALLEKIIQDDKASVTIKMRAEVLLALYQRNENKKTYYQIAEELKIAVATVRNTYKRFLSMGFDQCMKYQRNAKSNATTKLSQEQREKLMQMANSTPPEGHKKWTLQLLKEKAIEEKLIDQISIETIRRMLKQGDFKE
jgi:transposase